jgi:hypothetical protein
LAAREYGFMKSASGLLPELESRMARRGSKLLIPLIDDNGIKIAYRKTASDAQALDRRVMRNRFRPPRAAIPRD